MELLEKSFIFFAAKIVPNVISVVHLCGIDIEADLSCLLIFTDDDNYFLNPDKSN